MSAANASKLLAAEASTQVEVFANLFRGIVDEMAWIIYRSSHTTFVKETRDFGSGLVTREGELFAIPDSIGVTALIGISLLPIIEQIDTWEPGDIVIANDPYSTRGSVLHLPDLYLLAPVFVDDRLFCFAWAFVHSSDVGGAVPGSITGETEEIFQEGLRLRPVKLFRAGEVNRDVQAIISDNSRSPVLGWGDLTALCAALGKGSSRLVQLVERYGSDAVESSIYGTLDRSERLTRNALEAIPSGRYSFSEYFESDYVTGLPVKIELCLNVKEGGSVQLDFTGSDPQVRSSINIPAGGARHHPFHSLALVNFVITRTEGLHINGGILRCIDLKLPEASVVNAAYPSACSMRVLTVFRIHEAVLGALAQAVPEAVPAGGAGQLAITSISTTGLGGTGRVVVANAVEGGSGGMRGLDGLSGADLPAAALRNVPVEVLEAEAPVLVHRFALVPDSEGAGSYRGGFGIDYAFEIRARGVTVVTRGKNGHKFVAWGAHGGSAGTPGGSSVKTAKDATVLDLGKAAVYRPVPGDVITVSGGGGGGYGPPLERDPLRVRDDVFDGLISLERASTVYGVVIEGGEIDLEQTRTLRAAMSTGAARGAPFDFGPARQAWEEDFGEADSLMSDWLMDMPPNMRRSAQENVYKTLQAGPPPYSTALIREILDNVRDEEERSL